MSDWKRTTREVPFEGLLLEMVSAVKAHVELYNLGTILSDAVMCIQIDSEKVRKGLFGKSESTSQGAIVTPRWLTWVVKSLNAHAAVLSAQLSNVIVQDYAQTQFAKMVPDSGIQISGTFTDVSENAGAFLGLDEGPAAKKFRELVIQKTQDARK